MSALSSHEKETIILFNESPDNAEIFTYNGALQRQLDQLCNERSEIECTEVMEDFDLLAKRYSFPKKWVKIRPPRILTDRQKESFRENIAKARERKINSTP